jgi:hypothetical protein
MNSKLASRKLWVAIGGLLVVVATEFLGVDESTASSIIETITYIVPSYIGGQGIVDAFTAYSLNKNS